MNKRDEDFLRLYNTYRYKEQIKYYESRKKAFEAAQNEFINISTVLMILAALIGILSSVDAWGLRLWWAVLAVVFPTLSAALSTYNGLYAFERQAKIFQDTVLRLHAARIKSPYVRRPQQESDYPQAITEFVGEVEQVFGEERSQWGLLANEIKAVESPPA